jgi:hypothetical protein
MSDGDSEIERLNFEHEKWQADYRLREREIAIKEKEQARSPWLNPLVIAIFTAAAAGIGNIGVAYISGLQQRSAAEEQTKKVQAIEQEKSEAARILAVIQVADTEKSAQNLEFLLKAGLISDPNLVKSLTAFLENRKPGQGPSVPLAAITGELSTTCKFTIGPRAGTTLHYQLGPNITAAPIGAPCTDSTGSFGVAVKDSTDENK